MSQQPDMHGSLEIEALESPLSRVSVVLPAGQSLDRLVAARRFRPFSTEVVSFIEGFGRMLRSSAAVRQFPELVALGFWSRSANIRRLQARFESAYPDSVRRPRGIAFHVAPSNVDTIFVYSLLLSMLAGNANIVRVSSRSGEQSDQLMTLLGQALTDAAPEIAASIAVVRYDHDAAVTQALSHLANLRVVWGGDTTVNLIRQCSLNPTATELVFPNKFSFAIFGAATWLAETDRDGVAARFVNDSLYFGQAACSSPRSMAWLGSAEDIAAASTSFWKAVDDASARAGFEPEEAQAVSKLLAEQESAIEGGVDILPVGSNRVRVVRHGTLDSFGQPSGAGNGFFAEYRLNSLADLAPVSREDWQTVVSYGIAADAWTQFLNEGQPSGIERIVPVGTALDFDAVWDGVDLLTAMTRITALQ